MIVSRETTERLESYEALVRKWSPTINLVSRSDLKNLRQRHIVDSEQIFDAAGILGGHWVDLGTGGGFPGVVIAILAAEKAPGLQLTCVEADQRKAAFLMTAATSLGLSYRVLAERIENIPPQEADVVSARALAPLELLLPMAVRHLRPGGVAIFPKGSGHANEVRATRTAWRFSLEAIPSWTDPQARILKLGEIARA